MRRRPRSLAGLIGSLLLALFLAESVWAAACELTMTADGVSPIAAHGPGHDEGHPAEHHDGADRHEAPNCPLGHGGAMQGCGMSLPLLAAVTPGFAPPAEAAYVVVATEAEPHFLLGSDLFRPPRA